MLGTAVAFTIFACVIFPWMTIVAILFLGGSIAFVHYVMMCAREVKRIEGACMYYDFYFL